MKILTVNDRNYLVKLRLENGACNIFHPKKFVECNEVVFYVISTLNEYGANDGIEKMVNDYKEDSEQVVQDLKNLSSQFIKNDVLTEMFKDVLKIIEDNYDNLS